MSAIKGKLKTGSLVLLCLLLSTAAFSQSNDGGWTVKVEPRKVFIENQGQFRVPGLQNVKYAYDGGTTTYFFTPDGIRYSFLERWGKKSSINRQLKRKMNGRKWTKTEEEWVKKEDKDREMLYKTDAVDATWLNSNHDVEIIAEKTATDYFSYTIKEADGHLRNINYIKGYEKLTYKNLYPNIDVEYVFHPQDGIKYSIILHPGANPALVKMLYSKAPVLASGGNLEVTTIFGNIVEHAPVCFYQGDEGHTIQCAFSLDSNQVTFDLESYDNTRTVVIDPWVQTPGVSTPSGVWEVEVDQTGNIYIIAGGTPMQLLKYNSTGTIQWTYNSPYDTTNGDWLGALATDYNGNSYVTRGSSAAIIKVSPAGALVYSNPGNGLDEYWQIAFNCDQTKLLIGGTRLPLMPMGSYKSAMIFDVNPANGNVLATLFVGWSQGGLMGNPDEVRAITSSYNAKYYFLTLDSISAVDQDLATACPSPGIALGTSHGYNFSYKCENFRPDNGNGPISAIAANQNWVYTQDGSTVHRRDLNSGAIINAAAIPGGITTTVPIVGGKQAGNSGLALDDCGNVYCGSSDRIVKYDASLNILAQTNVLYRVSDVEVSPSGEVVICGSTGTSGSASRTGYVQSVDLSSCAPNVLVCCNANICDAGPFCDTDPATTLVSAAPGGVWSGPGITNPATGAFDPATAGAGSHWVVYTMACGSDSTLIQVNQCIVLTACLEPNGDITVTNGTGPFNWESQTITQNCAACLVGCTFPPGCAVNTTTWTSFGTGITITPPGTWPIRVTDTYGNSLTIANAGALSPCPSCPTLTITISNQINVLCNGGSTGSFTVTTSAGTGPYDYTLSLGATVIATYNNVAGAQNFTGLAAGTYTLDIRDNLNCPGTTTITITEPAALTGSNTVTNESCSGSCDGSVNLTAGGGTNPYMYAWTNGATTATPSGLCSGNYTVTITDFFGCTVTNAANISAGPTIVANAGLDQTICSGLSANLTASGGTSYQWSTGETTAAITVTPVANTSYFVTVTAGPCTDKDTVIVNVVTVIPQAGNNQTICAGQSATLTASGGTSYVWSNGGNSASTTVTPASTTTYYVTVTTGSCNAVDSVTVAVVPMPTANAGPDQNLCQMSTSLAAVPSVGSGTWTNLTGGVSITNATSATTTVSSAVPGTFLMIWTENNGNGCVDSDTVSITLAYPPATTFTISPPDCFGDTLIVTYTGNGVPSSTYNWTMTSATIISGSGDGPYEITYPAGGSYSISLNITQGVCVATPTTVNVTYPNPMVLTVSATDLTCFGSMNGTVNVAVTDGTQPYTYHWNNGSPASGQNSVPAGNYYVTVTDANGCVENGWTIVGQPSNMFIDVPDSIRICRDSTLTITASATGGTFPYSYQWNSGHASDVITVTPGASTTYVVTATDANQCTSSTLVSVYVNPPVYLTASSNIDSICPGEKVIISAQASSGTQPYTYLLDGDILYPAYVVYPNSSHTYTITVKDNCQQTASQYVPIYVYPSPPVSMSSNLVSGCDPLTVQFNESSPDSGQTYVWDFGDGESAYIKNPLHIFDEPGIFDVSITVTDKWGCVVSDEIDDWITVFPNPVAQYIAEPPFATIIKPVITFTNYSTLASVVNWYFGDGDSSLVYNPVHTYPGGMAGIYNVTLVVISANGCVDTVMGTIEIQDEFTFYAPTAFSPDNDGHNEMFFVTGSGIDETTFTIEIFDRWGEVIFESDKFNQGWDGTAKDHKLVPVGTYTWFAKFRDFQGILHVKSGPITVVR